MEFLVSSAADYPTEERVGLNPLRAGGGRRDVRFVHGEFKRLPKKVRNFSQILAALIFLFLF